MEARADLLGHRCATGLRIVGGYDGDVCFEQQRLETLEQQIVAVDEQWREHRVVVVPAPTFAQRVGTLHRTVGHESATNGVDAHTSHALDKGVEVVTVETRIHTTDAMEVAMQRVVVDGSCIGQLGLELIGAAQTVDGRNSCEQLLRGGGSHELAVVEAIDGRVGIQVPNHDSSLRGLQQGRLH